MDNELSASFYRRLWWQISYYATAFACVAPTTAWAALWLLGVPGSVNRVAVLSLGVLLLVLACVTTPRVDFSRLNLPKPEFNFDQDGNVIPFDEPPALDFRHIPLRAVARALCSCCMQPR